MLKEKITKWLGEVIKGAEHTLKLVPSSQRELFILELETDLKSRIPELEEMIEKEIQERLKNSWNKSIDENLPWDLGDAFIAINTLKGGKEKPYATH